MDPANQEIHLREMLDPVENPHQLPVPGDDLHEVCIERGAMGVLPPSPDPFGGHHHQNTWRR
jgi:hypothetical protein